MKFAMLFPGQGSQVVGMGADLVEVFPEARRTFEEADAVLGFALSRLCFEGPIEKLTETHHAQPALLTHSIAVQRILESRGIEACIAAGHSLGEYSALVATGSLQFADALRTVRRRGELMFESGRKQPGTMAAVIGLEESQIQEVCATTSRLGVCDLANLNAVDQIVISGDVAAIEAAMSRLKEAGAKIVKQLNVSGAFHSSLMREPASLLASYLDQVDIGDSRVPVIANVTAAAENRGERLRELLKRQIASPVRWAASMQELRRIESGEVLEVGPGNVLRGLLRRADRKAVCHTVGDRPSLEDLLEKTQAG